jgi:hypothetical protein
VLYRHYAFDHVVERLLHWDVVNQRFWLYDLLGTVLLGAPYALVLLLWGRGLSRATTGALVAIATTLFMWGLDRVFNDYVWDGDPTATSVRFYEWIHLLGVATLVPLAWGLARRGGRAWALGLVAGPVAAAILREVQLRWTWWHEHLLPQADNEHWVVQAVVYVAPFVLAALACWAIEVRAASPTRA